LPDSQLKGMLDVLRFVFRYLVFKEQLEGFLLLQN